MRVGWIVALAVGCGANHHVTLPAPPPNLTAAQRVQAFDRYRRGGEAVEWETSCRGSALGGQSCSTSSRDVLLLRDGTEVRDAEDLLPILSPESPAAAAARDVGAARKRRTRWKRIGWGIALGGVGLMVIGLGNEHRTFLLGLGVMVGGGAVGVAGSIANTSEIKAKTKLVFASYDESLAARFDLCVNGLAIVPCESNTPGALPPPPEPDPALRSLRRR